LIHFNKIDQWEMYASRTDPLELHNIYTEQAGANPEKELKEKLLRLKKEMRNEDQIANELPQDSPWRITRPTDPNFSRPRFGALFAPPPR